MYIRIMNASRTTSSAEKRRTSGDRKLNREDACRDVSRSARYGLTWTPSRDESLFADGASRSLSPSPRNLNTVTVTDRREERSFGTPYEFNRAEFEEFFRLDRERCVEKCEKFSAWPKPTAVASRANSNDLDSFECWLSGEKFFQTPEKTYDNDDDNFNIPTRDKSDCDGDEDRDSEATKNQVRKSISHSRHDVSLEFLQPSFQRAMGNACDLKKTIDSINSLKASKGTSKDDETITTIHKSLFVDHQRSSSASLRSREEENIINNQKPARNPSNRSTIENVSSLNLNLLDSVAALGAANIHNHIYLSSRCLDRYFDIPLSKLLKLTRRNARVSRIRRRILRRPKRSRSRLVGTTVHRNGSMKFKVESLNKTGKSQKERAPPKRDVCDLLAEIDAELSANLRSVEKLREKLPSCISIDTVSTPEIKRTLNEVARRCMNCIRNSNDRDEAVARINDLLSKTVHDFREVVKREKRLLLQEEEYYMRLQLESIQGRQDFQKIKGLKYDADGTPLNEFRANLVDRKAIMRKLLNNISILTNDLCYIEDNKENIKKSVNRKTEDRDPTKNRPAINKSDDKASRVKTAKQYFTKKESQTKAQMNLLSKTRPPMSTGKNKTISKDTVGNKDRVKDKTPRENEDRPERQSLDKGKRSVHTVLSNFGNHVNAGSHLENSKVVKDKKNNSAATSPINCDVLSDRSKQPIIRRKRHTLDKQSVWKPGGAIKSFTSNSATFLHVEPSNRRTWHVFCDKENPEPTKSAPIKHANPSEPAGSKKNIFKDSQRNENFREERVTKLCKLLAEVKKESKDGANALLETRSSMYTQSEAPSLGNSATTVRAKNTEMNLIKSNSFGPKPRPGIHRTSCNNKNHPNGLQRDTKLSFQDKSETLQSKDNSTNKLESSNFSSSFVTKLASRNEKNETENENIPNEKNFTDSDGKFDTATSSMPLLDVSDKLSTNLTNARSSHVSIKSNLADNESNETKNTPLVDQRPFDPPMSVVSTSNANDEVNVDHNIRLERRIPSFISFADVSCNAEFSSASNSTTKVASSKCCQVSLSSLSSRAYSSYDRFGKNRSEIEIIPTVERDSLEPSTDDDREDESEYSGSKGDKTIPDFYTIRGQRNRHELSLSSLKEFLHDQGISTDLVEKAEEKYKLKSQDDRRETSIRKAMEFSLLNVSKNPTSFDKISIGPESGIDSLTKDEFKSAESIKSVTRSSDYSIDTDRKKIDDESTLGRKKSQSSQTISDSKEVCDAFTYAEDIKSDCSMYVDATVSCCEMSLKVSSKDVATEIFHQDKSILSPRRMVQTQTKPYISSTKCVITDIVLELGKDEHRENKNFNDGWTETGDLKREQTNYANEGLTMPQQDESKIDLGECSEFLPSTEDGVSLIFEKSSLSESFSHQLKDIKEQLQSVDAQLNKLQDTAKETSDACSQISETASIASKSIEEVSSMTALKLQTSEEPLERSNTDLDETGDNVLPSDIISALEAMEQYGVNLYEATQIYREHSNNERFKERGKSSSSGSPSGSTSGSTSGSPSDVSVAASKRSESVDLASLREVERESYHFDDKDSAGKTEIDASETACYVEEKPYRVFNEFKATAFLEESDETESFASARLKDFYRDKITESTSQKSSYTSIFSEGKSVTEKIPSVLSIKDERLEIVEHPENKEGEEIYDSPEFVLSRGALLLLTYLTICVFVFCCLKFSMTCVSLIL